MMTPSQDPTALPPLPEELSNEIAREFWCTRYGAENPVLSYRIVNMIWRQDIDRVRAVRKAVRLALHRLIQRGYRVRQDQEKPGSTPDTLVRAVAHAMWVAEYGLAHPDMAYKEVEAVWAGDATRVRNARDVCKLALVRLGKRGIVISEPQ